jgi:cysteine desulfuration protein SufE
MSGMTIPEIQEEIIDEFEFLRETDIDMFYQELIDQGKTLKPYPEELKTDNYLVKGCLSRVWVNAFLKDGKMKLEADSDGQISKGVIALLVKVYNDQTPEDILSTELYFPDRIGLPSALTMGRSSGLVSMIKKIRQLAAENQNNLAK